MKTIIINFYIRMCANLNCWNLVEIRYDQLKKPRHYCSKKCRYAWLSQRLSGDGNPAKQSGVGAKISAARLGHEVTPETRKLLSISVIKYFSNPINRENTSIRMKKYYKNHPEFNPRNGEESRKKTSNRMKISNPMSFPGAKERMSVIKKAWHAEHQGYQSGPLSSTWRGGTSYYPYCPKFNAEFKRRCRAFF